MKKSALPTTAVLGLLIGSLVSQAADLPSQPEYKATVMVAPVPSWTGCYIGGNVGYGWGRAEAETASGGISWTNAGFTGGGQIGCDYQFAGTGFVVGIRDMFNWSGHESSGTFTSGPLAGSTAASSTKWVNTFTGRVGYAVIPTALFYVQGGGAWSRVDVDITSAAGVQTAQCANNTGGYDVGAGLEYKFAPNWSGFIEYNYMNFGTNSGTTTTGVNVNFKKDSQNILFGVNWRM
jgi:outer membrane immunogenic protein